MCEGVNHGHVFEESVQILARKLRETIMAFAEQRRLNFDLAKLAQTPVSLEEFTRLTLMLALDHWPASELEMEV